MDLRQYNNKYGQLGDGIKRDIFRQVVLILALVCRLSIRKTSTFLGTMQNASPEFVKHRSYIPVQQEVCTLGILLYGLYNVGH
jgi:hypothetical protein